MRLSPIATSLDLAQKLLETADRVFQPVHKQLETVSPIVRTALTCPYREQLSQRNLKSPGDCLQNLQSTGAAPVLPTGHGVLRIADGSPQLGLSPTALQPPKSDLGTHVHVEVLPHPPCLEQTADNSLTRRTRFAIMLRKIAFRPYPASIPREGDRARQEKQAPSVRCNAMRKSLSLGVIALGFLLMTPLPARSQLLLVTGRYRVVQVDRRHQRIGIALRDANPNVRQNWVYIKESTKIVKREYLGHGAFRDEFLTFDGFFHSIRKGTLLKVYGGRDWDGSINAKKIWL